MLLFYFTAAIAVIATLLAVTRLHAVHALLYFIISLLAVAVVFYQLGAPFLAALEVIVYAGAIMVLFVFVVMMLNLGSEAVAEERRMFTPGMLVGPVILALALGGELALLIALPGSTAPGGAGTTPKQVGTALYMLYPVAVELAGLILLAGLVGAFHLGHGERTGLPYAGQLSFKRRFTANLPSTTTTMTGPTEKTP